MKQQINNVGVYVRLSNSDKYQSESESIKNQMSIIETYCSKHNLTINEIYIDDGYTGSNFERPEFKRLVEDIKIGKINVVITKDLSRLGRSLLGSGYYLEYFFPRYQVRYISINDNYDSLTITDDNIIALKNYLNELYIKECRKKARFQTDRRSENTTMSLAPYGYIRINGKLFIDEKVVNIVKEIFERKLNKEKYNSIANHLNERKIIAPGAYKYKKNKDKNFIWTAHSIYMIIKNKTYCGDSINLKSYNCKRNDKSHQIIIKNTHQAIIDRETFEKVQKMIVSKEINVSDKDRLKSYFYNNDKSLIYDSKCRVYRIKAGAIKVSAELLHDLVYEECNKYYNEIIEDKEKFIKNYIKRTKLYNILKELQLEEKHLNIKYEKLLDDYLMKKIDKHKFIVETNIIKEKLEDNTKQQNKQKVEEQNFNAEIQEYEKYLDKLKNINQKELPKLDFIRMLSTRCYITKCNNEYQLQIVMRKSINNV